jgi:hypothetical protein
MEGTPKAPITGTLATTSAGTSQADDRPTSWSAAPTAQTISVMLGARDTTRTGPAGAGTMGPAGLQPAASTAVAKQPIQMRTSISVLSPKECIKYCRAGDKVKMFFRNQFPE